MTYLPLVTIFMKRQPHEYVGIVKLKDVGSAQERQDKRQSLPHPRLNQSEETYSVIISFVGIQTHLSLTFSACPVPGSLLQWCPYCVALREREGGTNNHVGNNIVEIEQNSGTERTRYIECGKAETRIEADIVLNGAQGRSYILTRDIAQTQKLSMF